MPETKSYESIAANVAAVRETMQQAAQRAGRDVSEITLVAATKVQTSDTIRNAIQAGITVCGENRVQELVAHLEDNAYEGARVHFIGHLQTNKVKFVVGKVDMIESIDSTRLMDAVEKQAAKLDIVQDILLEVNIGDEESKGGAGIDEVLPLAQYALSCPHLRLRGLMCIPPATASEEENRGFFRSQRLQLCPRRLDTQCVLHIHQRPAYQDHIIFIIIVDILLRHHMDPCADKSLCAAQILASCLHAV